MIDTRKQMKIYLGSIKTVGSINHKKFKIDFRKGIYPDNPTLKNGDVVRVRRKFLAKSSDNLGTVTNPFQGIVTIWSLFKIVD